MCTSFYLAALHAAIVMGKVLGDEISTYEKILEAGKGFIEKELFNGEYFIQKIQWKGLRSADPVEMSKHSFNLNYSTEALELLQKEGPKYQYGDGCLSDGILGEWLAWASGLEMTVSPDKIEKHLLAVHQYNFRSDLSDFPNPQRPAYAFGHESGLILCSWPRGGKPSLPFVYSEEVWTGIDTRWRHILFLSAMWKRAWKSSGPAGAATTERGAIRSMRLNAATGMPGPWLRMRFFRRSRVRGTMRSIGPFTWNRKSGAISAVSFRPRLASEQLASGTENLSLK
jgi:hypothetical protein